MGKSRSKKQLTPGQLRSRGWTKSLMNTLLPKPRYRHFNGRSMPVWEREDVQAAEATETFQKQNLGAKPQGEAGRAAQQATHTVSKALTKLWNQAEKDDSLAWTLAGHYHRAVLDHLPAAARGRMLRASQITGYLGSFLGLEKRCDGLSLPGELTHFVQAAGWMGPNENAPLAGHVRVRYARVLHAAAQQAIDQFTQAQPEADLAACWRGRTSPPSSCSPGPSGRSTPSGTSPRSSRRA